MLRLGTRRFQGSHETLLSLSELSADRLVGLSVPSFCRQFTGPSSIGLARYRLITCKPINIGTAGKVIGYALYANGGRIGQQWTLLAQNAHTYAERALQ